MNAICTDGELGSTCMSDAACADGKCGPVIEIPIPGIIPDLCNECDDSMDCMGGNLCSPVFDLQMFSGQKSCVAPGSVMNDNLCPEGPDGPMVCMSGHCNSATIMGIVEVFVCGECDAATATASPARPACPPWPPDRLQRLHLRLNHAPTIHSPTIQDGPQHPSTGLGGRFLPPSPQPPRTPIARSTHG
jgi:hypothetical protein